MHMQNCWNPTLNHGRAVRHDREHCARVSTGAIEDPEQMSR